MTRPDWRGLLLAAVALTFLFAAALTADGQTPRTLPPECSRWQPPLNYPSAPVSVQARAEMQANTGPWTATRPPEGLAPSYPNLLAVFEAVWGRPSSDAIRYVDATPESPKLARATEAIREIVRPPWVDRCCDEYQHQVAFGSFPALYGRLPTLGQETLLMARSPRSGGANSSWWPDSAIYNAARCLSFTERPSVFPDVPPGQGEPFWRATLRSYGEVGLPLRDAAGNVVTEASIRCHFDPECDGGEPTPPPAPAPPPPPPEPPPCVPYAGSSCEARCVQVGKDAAWCLDPARENGARHLFNLCAPVCRGNEPDEPDEPEEPEEPTSECPPTAFERACRDLGISPERCRTLARWVAACNPDCDPKCYIPGIPSTGVNTVEIGPPGGGS